MIGIILRLDRNMRYMIIVAVVVFALGCAERDVSKQPIPKTDVAVTSNFKEPRVIFAAPEGFEWSNENRIWYNKNIRTSINVAHEPGKAFQAVVDDFVADRMMEANMELIRKDIRIDDGRSILLVHGNRLKAKYPQQFSMVAFATSSGCAQVTSVYPMGLPEELKTQIEDALLTSRYETPD